MNPATSTVHLIKLWLMYIKNTWLCKQASFYFDLFFCFTVANTDTGKAPEAGVVQIVDVTLEKFAIFDIEIHTHTVQHTNTHMHLQHTQIIQMLTIGLSPAQIVPEVLLTRIYDHSAIKAGWIL